MLPPISKRSTGEGPVRCVLFDGDVILDVLLDRQPYYGPSAAALETAAKGQVVGHVAAHVVTTLAYFLRQRVGSRQLRTALARLLACLHVAPVTEREIRSALASPIRDFEDAVGHEAALAVQANVIVTRNVSDYKGSTIPAVLPEVYLAGLA